MKIKFVQLESHTFFTDLDFVTMSAAERGLYEQELGGTAKRTLTSQSISFAGAQDDKSEKPHDASEHRVSSIRY